MHLLIVTAFFPPASAAGTQRPARLARGMQARGWQVHVLTLAPQCALRLDETTLGDIPPDVTVHREPCWSLWWHSRRWVTAPRGLQRVAAKARRALARATESLVPADELYPWAVSGTRRGAAIVRQNNIDIIWATSPTITTLLLAERIGVRTGVPFVADFRDVQDDAEPSALSRRGRQRLRIERRVLGAAAGITFVAPGQIETLRRKHAFVDDKPQELVYNWFEASEVHDLTPTRFEQPTILHGGSLYGGTRRLDGFLAGLEAVARNRPVETRPRFVQIGPPTDINCLRQQARDAGVASLVEAGASLPRADFLAACHGADILLLAVGRDRGTVQHAGAIPGKLYDYFAAGRPILVVGPPDCEAARMVTQLKRGLAVPDDDAQVAAQAIEALLNGQTVRSNLDLRPEAVAQFESAHVVQQMAEFLSRVSFAERGRQTERPVPSAS